MNFKTLTTLALTLLVSLNAHATIRESAFEQQGRKTLREYNASLDAVEAYLDRALKRKETCIRHPELRLDMLQDITDGFYPIEYTKTQPTDHKIFKAQKDYSRTCLQKLNTHELKEKFKAAYEIYENLTTTNGLLSVFFKKAAQYHKFNYGEELHVMGSKEHGHLIYLATHETWKRTAVCYLKFSAFLHNAWGLQQIPDYLASTEYGFSAQWYATLTAESKDSGKSHQMKGKLHFSIQKKKKTFDQEVNFTYDTGAMSVCIPFYLLQSQLGLEEGDLTWDKPTSTAAGPSMAASLYIHHLQLHENVVFRGMKILVIRGDTALLGTNISNQFLKEFRVGDKKKFWVKKNNWT